MGAQPHSSPLTVAPPPPSHLVKEPPKKKEKSPGDSFWANRTAGESRSRGRSGGASGSCPPPPRARKGVKESEGDINPFVPGTHPLST